jgi:hypothetical protein
VLAVRAAFDQPSGTLRAELLEDLAWEKADASTSRKQSGKLELPVSAHSRANGAAHGARLLLPDTHIAFGRPSDCQYSLRGCTSCKPRLPIACRLIGPG